MTYKNSREILKNKLIKELYGPEPLGNKLFEFEEPIEIIQSNDEDKKDFSLRRNGPYRQKNGQEILINERPSSRYGLGTIHPIFIPNQENQDQTDIEANKFDISETLAKDDLVNSNEAYISENVQKKINERLNINNSEDDDIGFEVASSHKTNINAIGLTIKLDPTKGDHLIIEPKDNEKSAIYRHKEIKVTYFNNGEEGSSNDDWYFRYPIDYKIKISLTELQENIANAYPIENDLINSIGLDLKFKVLLRKESRNSSNLVVTVTLCNYGIKSETINFRYDCKCFYQSDFKISYIKNDENHYFLPVADNSSTSFQKNDESKEDLNLDMLYEDYKTFAVGHGVAAGWNNIYQQNPKSVFTSAFAEHDVPNVTPDISDSNGNLIKIPINILSDEKKFDEIGLVKLKLFVSEYQIWIEEKKISISKLKNKYQETAKENLSLCENQLSKMLEGIRAIEEDKRTKQAFLFANYSILLQMYMGKEVREPLYLNTEGKIIYSRDYKDPINSIDENNFTWRPFQIGFILSSLTSFIEESKNFNLELRKNIDLIFFPTGGGKTETYLALVAFSSFYRKLVNQNDQGVNVIMRYTLRLLTTQQFERASSLICAMEYIRVKNESLLGKHKFGIGAWLGNEVTPGKRTDAKTLLKNVSGDRYQQVKQSFLLSCCPWCKAQFKRYQLNKNKPNHQNHGKKEAVSSKFDLDDFKGIVNVGSRTAFQCPDKECDFSKNKAGTLPIYVVDEDIFEFKPTLVIGTIDKFAQLIWDPSSKALFGLDKNSQRIHKPPQLVLQDELHLINGPLGSVSGLFEIIIDVLCKDKEIPVKIICSTATIKRYKQQVLGLYGRDTAKIFPPFGININDNFFSKFAVNEKGEYINPKKFIGIISSNFKSTQTTQVRAYSCLFNATKTDLTSESNDPYYTMMCYFNSLRELSTTLTLLQIDIVDRLDELRTRYGFKLEEMRQIKNFEELTSRHSGASLKRIMDNLALNSNDPNGRTLDLVVCSNIIEVGVDIDRLSLLTVLNQPKSVATYIQVAGRIGRRWMDDKQEPGRPGLVLTIYSHLRSRDLAYYEMFKSFHQSMYKYVESSSITPFSRPVLERSLHAVMIAYVRLLGGESYANIPYPFPNELLSRFKRLIVDRAMQIDPNEKGTVEEIFNRRFEEWQNHQETEWETNNPKPDNVPIMYRAGSYVSQRVMNNAWPTQTSMRSVDKECMVEIFNPKNERQSKKMMGNE